MSLSNMVSSAVVEVEATGRLSADSLKDLAETARLVHTLEIASVQLRTAYNELAAARETSLRLAAAEANIAALLSRVDHPAPTPTNGRKP
jgi:hypothetical protein